MKYFTYLDFLIVFCVLLQKNSSAISVNNYLQNEGVLENLNNQINTDDGLSRNTTSPEISNPEIESQEQEFLDISDIKVFPGEIYKNFFFFDI